MGARKAPDRVIERSFGTQWPGEQRCDDIMHPRLTGKERANGGGDGHFDVRCLRCFQQDGRSESAFRNRAPIRKQGLY